MYLYLLHNLTIFKNFQCFQYSFTSHFLFLLVSWFFLLFHFVPLHYFIATSDITAFTCLKCILSLFLKDIFLGHGILGWQLFSFSILKNILLSSGFYSFWLSVVEKSALSHIFVYYECDKPLFSYCSEAFFLYLGSKQLYFDCSQYLFIWIC